MNNLHNWKMIGGIALMFIVGGLQAVVAGHFSWASGIETFLPVLIGIEHYIGGNTSS